MTDKNYQDDVVFEPEEDQPKKKNTSQAAESDEFIPEDGEGNTGTPKDIVKALRVKLEKAVAEKQEYLDGWQRARADLVNARKRDEEEKKQFIKYANIELIEDIIPVLDSFDMAMGNKEAWEKADKNWRTGVEYIYSQLTNALKSHGLHVLCPENEQFNPALHDSVESVLTHEKSEDGTIDAVLQKGYRLNDKMIRPAKVKVKEWKES